VQDGKPIALVTGASSGIGLACASLLAAKGYRVYGTSRKIIDSPSKDSTESFTMLPMDVTDDASVTHCIDTILAREGRLDILVNNAGAGIAGAIENTSTEEARAQFDVNFFGAFRVCRAVLPILRRQGHGYIINIGSIGGLIALPYQAMYSASKFALEGFTEALQLEVRPFGINVVLIEPGDHKTGFTQNRIWTEASSHDEVYLQTAKAAVDRMASDEQQGPSPNKIAQLVLRIVNQPNPRLRYTVGPGIQRAAVFLKRLLPYRLLEYGMRKYYRLNVPE
jgi:NAD(P)-dependent dehydrogenase (short-subunit alcohol dehydrogenase family)